MGFGRACDKGGKPQPINIGDLIHAPPRTTHWHGAGKDCAMTHLAIGLGETRWLEAVNDEEYKIIDGQFSNRLGRLGCPSSLKLCWICWNEIT